MAGRPLKAVDRDASAAARLGADLRALRVERDLTLAELGDKISFSAQYISGAELAMTIVSARFVAACDRALGAGGALVGLLPDVVWEKELRRQERSRARDGPAPSLRGASDDDADPTSRRGPVEADAATALGPGAALAPAAGRAIDPALPGHLTSLLAILGAHDAAYGPREVLGTVRRELWVIAGDREVARGALRIDLMRVEARWTIYAAWLCEDTGDRLGALRYLSALCSWPVRLIIPTSWRGLARDRRSGPIPRARSASPKRLCGLRASARTHARCAPYAPHTPTHESPTPTRPPACSPTRTNWPRTTAPRRHCPQTRRCRDSSCAAGKHAAGRCWSPPKAWHCTTTSCATGHARSEDATAACTRPVSRSPAPPPASSTVQGPKAARY
jgi:transcriptional regulator with XRE-family HTH domain